MMLRLLGPAVLLGLVACGSSSPPPKVAEVPLDQTEPANEPPPPPPPAATDSADPGAGAGAASVASPDDGAGKGGRPSGGTVPPAANPGKVGAIISVKECSELSDKGIELMAFGEGGPLRGTSGKQKEQQLAMLKQVAGSDPNFAKMKAECGRTIHRSQYDCGMNARSAAEWQNCIR